MKYTEVQGYCGILGFDFDSEICCVVNSLKFTDFLPVPYTYTEEL